MSIDYTTFVMGLSQPTRFVSILTSSSANSSTEFLDDSYNVDRKYFVSSNQTLSSDLYNIYNPSIEALPYSSNYIAVFSTLADMAESDNDELHIEKEVAKAAIFLATKLVSSNIPPPEILRHGPDSAVLGWSNDEYSLYLTITSKKAYALATDSTGVRARQNFSPVGLISVDSLLRIPFLPSE